MAEAFTLDAAVDYSQADTQLYETNKRSLETENDDHVTYKRANLTGKSPMLKTMVPNHIAGSIIGKKGQTIAVMQEQTGAKIKLSSSNEFYPGTSERVVVVVGELHQILSMLDLVTEKIMLELPGRGASPMAQLPERCNQIKLIVPNSTAGMIIGKGGSFIRGITDETGARLQISQKSTEISGERVVTISGEPEQTKAAAAVVITKCQDDPEHSLNNNLSYSGYGSAPPSSMRNGGGGTPTGMGGGGMGGGGMGGGGMGGGGMGGGGFGNLSSMLQGLGGGTRDPPGNSPVANMLGQANNMQMASNPLASNSPLTTMLGMQQLSGIGNPVTTTITTHATYEMSVPDQLVGIILGRGGKTLSEFMQFSNANITISHKGEFISGTSNRKVVITGDPTCVQTAYFLITQKIMQEYPK